MTEASSTPSTALPIVDVVSSVPVEGAIFTTYTLSLAWFETHLLRALERSGARQILLLADPVGINASLGEGLVTGAGVRYTVEPAGAPKGAFHAKVGVLWSRDCLLVAVGSGNLTFAGMHRNLECWEVLVAGLPVSDGRHLHRSVAEDILSFLTNLHARVEAGGRAASTLAAAHCAVTSWLPRLPSTVSPVRWLDSTREPIGEQLTRHLGSREGRRLQVLSPFHDRDGAAIDRLADRLNAGAIEVLYVGSSTTYPLSRKAKVRGVAARRLEIENQTRPLHAKVFHVVDDTESHIMSGSTNATWQALWTTNNVEVSLLRGGTFENLLRTSPGTPDLEVVEYKEAELRLLTIQWARAADDHVRAHLRWLGPAPLDHVLVGFVDSLDEPNAAAWPDDGVIRVRLPASFNSLRPRALRIEASAFVDGRRWSARSWVAFDELLNATREFRAALSAWNRLLLGDSTEADSDEDDTVLLRVFAEEHAHTIEAVGSGVFRTHRARSGENADDGEEVSIPLRLIEALTRLPLPPRTAAGGHAGNFIDDVEQAMRAAFGVMDEPAEVHDDEGDEPGGAAQLLKKPRPRLPRSMRQALDDFEASFVEAANAIRRAPAKPAHVLAYSSLCARLVLRYRLRDGENRAGFWSSAATLIRTLLCPLANRAALVSLLHAPGAALAEDAAQLLALLLALLSWHDSGGRLEGESEPRSQPMRADVVREALAALDRAAGRAVAPSSLPRSLDEVFPCAPGTLAEVLLLMRQTPSASDRALALKLHLEAVMRSETKPRMTGPDSEVSRSARRSAPLFVEPWTTSCPRCHQALAASVCGRLLLREPIQCRNTRCSRWLVPSEGA